MLIKTLVFRGEDRVNQGLGNIVDAHQRPPLLAEFADQLAVSAKHPQWYLRAVIGEQFEGRQGGVDDRSGERQEHDAGGQGRAQQQGGEAPPA